MFGAIIYAAFTPAEAQEGAVSQTHPSRPGRIAQPLKGKAK